MLGKNCTKKSQKIGTNLILSKEKAGQCTKNRDCPSKIGTVGKYGLASYGTRLSTNIESRKNKFEALSILLNAYMLLVYSLQAKLIETMSIEIF